MTQSTDLDMSFLHQVVVQIARPPSDGFILQESNTSIGSTDSEIQTYFGSGHSKS